MWMKLCASILCAVYVIYFLYMGIIPIPILPEDLLFVSAVSLIASVVVPLSGMPETEFMGGDDADEKEPYHVSNSITINLSRIRCCKLELALIMD